MGISPVTLCKRLNLSGSLVRRLAEGGTITLETVDKIRTYIRDNQPPPAAKAPEHEGTDAT